MLTRNKRVALALLLVILVSFLSIVVRSNHRSASSKVDSGSAMERLRYDPNFGAAERVSAYIADAYAWEKNAVPSDPELEQKMRSEFRSRLYGKSDQADSSIRELIQERGRVLLDSRNASLQSLKEIAAVHWIGDEWKEEVLLLSNPPKHDPAKERITDMMTTSDGSVEVTTETEAEIRTYRVELADGKWLIRRYQWRPAKP